MADSKKIVRPPPPKKIMEFLDGYVIGQELAKKCLSVGVYNHYKKVYHSLQFKPTKKKTKRESKSKNKKTERESDYESDDYESDDCESDDCESDDLESEQVTDSKLLDEKTPQLKSDCCASEQVAGSKSLDKIAHQLKLDKSNILMLGPTGSGKTLLAQTIAECLDVPFVICDCTTLTENGYYGDDVDSVIRQLLFKTKYEYECEN